MNHPGDAKFFDLCSGFWRHAYRPLPAQTGADKDHGRQREKDIRSKGKADARQEVGTDGHHGTQGLGCQQCKAPFTAAPVCAGQRAPRRMLAGGPKGTTH
jgi:hypothetical protein